MARKLEVPITGDASSYMRALKQAQGRTQKFGMLAKAALVGGVAAGMYAVGKAAKIGWDEYNEGAKVAAQTNAVIKSTGGVANMTAKEVTDLANALHLKTTFDDEAIQSGENILLTFRNVRDEVGKGNDIFTEATKLTLDFAQAMDMDLNSAALSVGKALNDPIKGLTRLGKQGVTFTQQQTDLITKLQEMGKTAQAQKIILEELRKEFGGSAEAAGKTFGGQLTILRNRLDDFLGLVVGKAIPYLQRLAKWVGPHLTNAMNQAKEVTQQLRQRWAELGALLEKHQDTVRVVTKVMGYAYKAAQIWIKWNILLYGTLIKIDLAVLKVALVIGDKLIAAFRKVAGPARAAFAAVATAVRFALGPIFALIAAVEKLIGLYNSLKGAITSTGTGAPTGRGGSGGRTNPNIPQGASGGFVARSGLAIIHKGETLVPRAAGAGWGSGDIVVQVDGMTLLRATRRAQRRYEARN